MLRQMTPTNQLFESKISMEARKQDKEIIIRSVALESFSREFVFVKLSLLSRLAKARLKVSL